MVAPEHVGQITGLLADSGMDYTVMIADVQAQLNTQTVAPDAATLADFDYSKYHTYDQVCLPAPISANF